MFPQFAGETLTATPRSPFSAKSPRIRSGPCRVRDSNGELTGMANRLTRGHPPRREIGRAPRRRLGKGVVTATPARPISTIAPFTPPVPGADNRPMPEPTLDRELLVLVYDELRSLARSRLAGNSNRNTLQPTALVHEAYLRITKRGDTRWNSKGHFFGAAAEAMRQILVEQARAKSRLKRGGDREHVSVAADEIASDSTLPPDDLLAIDDAITALDIQDPSLAMLIKLRFYSGMAPDEIAVLLEVSRRTVERRWRYAAALLREHLELHRTKDQVDDRSA